MIRHGVDATQIDTMVIMLCPQSSTYGRNKSVMIVEMPLQRIICSSTLISGYNIMFFTLADFQYMSTGEETDSWVRSKLDFAEGLCGLARISLFLVILLVIIACTHSFWYEKYSLI